MPLRQYMRYFSHSTVPNVSSEGGLAKVGFLSTHPPQPSWVKWLLRVCVAYTKGSFGRTEIYTVYPHAMNALQAGH
jgi:hypothetical protein